jgi:DNA-binding MarR family transcriptional regulator
MLEPNEVIHQTVRLRIMAILAGVPEDEAIEFTRLKEMLKVTDGNLGAHINTLEKVGYIEVLKDFVGKKPRTRVLITPVGRLAFDGHVAYLRQVLENSA